MPHISASDLRVGDSVSLLKTMNGVRRLDGETTTIKAGSQGTVLSFDRDAHRACVQVLFEEDRLLSLDNTWVSRRLGKGAA